MWCVASWLAGWLRRAGEVALGCCLAGRALEQAGGGVPRWGVASRPAGGLRSATPLAD